MPARLLLPLLLGGSLLLPAAATAARSGEVIPGRYIVIYKSSVSAPASETDQRERRGGFQARFTYTRGIKGFAARLNSQQLGRLRSDPEVAAVVADRTVRIDATPLAGETVPPGITRVGATGHGASSVNVAVIDTGVDLAHPDLQAVSGTNCVTIGAAANDDHGHGTHVAGTIAARNNGSGVIGVAPGTRIYAVKVLDSRGSGTLSQVVCGIDWVANNAAALNIRVANMSLGGVGSALGPCSTTSDPEHLAICRATAAGVTFVVAAGNNAYDFDYAPSPDVPAAYAEALTVTAMSDTDGRGGGLGPVPSCRSGEADDRYASFSNWAATAAGQAHTLAAPGVCIRSTYKGSSYAVMSGTSMASPHMAGQVALCLGEEGASGPCSGLSPAAIITKLRSDASAYNSSTLGFGFVGDPLHAPLSGRYYGYLLPVGAPASTTPTNPTPPPTGPVSLAPASGTILSGSQRSGSLSSVFADDTAYLGINSTTNKTRTAAWYGSFTGVPSTLTALSATWKGKSSLSCSHTLALYNWATASWNVLDSRTLGTTEVQIGISASGTLANYVSGGQVRVRSSCSNSSSSFYTSTNLLQLTYSG